MKELNSFNDQIIMPNIFKFPRKIVLTVLLSAFLTSFVIAETQIGMVNVTAAVLGEKPIVNLITPTIGINTGAVVLTKIVGRNFDNVYGVSLDDASSTVLAGTITLTDACDSNGDNCGGGGSYQKITGLSVPAEINPGVYNVLVTTPLGTNLLSDVKFTVTAAAATTNPSINDVQPSYISMMANLPNPGDIVNVSFAISDSDTNAVEFDTDSNILLVTNVSTGNYSPANRTTTAATSTGGEVVSFDVSAISSPEGYGTLDIRVGDGGTLPPSGNTSFKEVNIFIEPSW